MMSRETAFDHENRSGTGKTDSRFYAWTDNLAWRMHPQPLVGLRRTTEVKAQRYFSFYWH